MSRRISKRVREEAALICSMAACEPGDGWAALTIARNVEVDDDVWDLVRFATAHAYDVRDDGQYEIACAEAEALLRAGWSPR